MKRVLLLSLFLLSFIAPAYAAEDGLVAHYDFNEGSGAVLQDVSGNENNGTIYGAAWTNGINGSALEFDGVDDWIQFNDGPAIKNPQFTIGIWINPSIDLNFKIVPGYMDAVPFFMKTDLSQYADADGFDLQYVYPERVVFGLANKHYRYQVNFLNSTLNSSNWYNIVGTYDGSFGRIYLNGELVGTEKLNIPIEYYGGHPKVGRALYGNVYRYFNGSIDDIKIYNRALSAEEIKAEYKKYSMPQEPQDSDGDGLPDENETRYELNPHSVDTDSDGIGDFEEYELLSKYAPVFQYTPDLYYTEFYPQPVSIFLNYSDIYRLPFFKEAEGPLSEEKISGYGKKYFMDFKENNFYLIPPDNVYKKAHDALLPEYGYALYMRATTSAYNGQEYLVLQYWHHYLYNDFFYTKYVGDHEGDWELVEIILDKSTRTPLYAAYSQHDDSSYRHGGQIKSWADVQKETTHPRVYVAKGSHASYFEAGNFNLLKWVKNMADWTSTLGHKLEYASFNRTIILRDDPGMDNQKWLLYGGRWGAILINNDTDILGINGPTGPAQKEEKWNRSAEWGLKYLTRQLMHEYIFARLDAGALTVWDAFGREVAFVNNNIIKRIPKAEVISVGNVPIYVLPWDAGEEQMMMSMAASSIAEPSDYTYVIAPDGTYTFELYIANETEAKHIVFYNVEGANSTMDNVWIKGNKLYMNTTDREKHLDIMLEYMNETDAFSANLTGITFSGKETLVIKIKGWTNLGQECKKEKKAKEIHAKKQKKCKDVVKVSRKKQHSGPSQDSEKGRELQDENERDDDE